MAIELPPPMPRIMKIIMSGQARKISTGRCSGLTARFPGRLAERGLTATPEQLLTTQALQPPPSSFFQIQAPLDLGF